MAESLPDQAQPERPDLIPQEAWRLLITEPSVNDYERAAALIIAAELERQAADLSERAARRHAVGLDDGPQCDGECESSDCHTVSAVAAYSMAAARLRSQAADLMREGGGSRG